ncbi:hypothetical protein BBAD15_g12189 [Beauveria bassiana D1-5]|uniref:Uncharacterized protein n=1 Tax=Beauveria bassiana D1-5 TaxID=1245745 RepID=A0A0A2V954_BEABA|nr:hypothetical protein BBAD15_g12189 [Beauveria bassiana D1-5]
MSANSVVSQLRGLLEKAEQILPKLTKLYPTEEQWTALSDLSRGLSAAGTAIGDRVQQLKNTREHRAWKESEKHRLHALACVGDLLTSNRLKQATIFRRNIVAIFEGPKHSLFDSDDVRVRKEATQRRCEQIRDTSHDGVISWAIAFAPSLWAGGAMANDIFSCILDSIEPDQSPPWPSVIRTTLQMLQEDEPRLQNSPDFGKFLAGQEEEPSNTYQGGVFIVHKEDVRYALSLDQHVWEIWLTNPEQRYNTYDGMKRSFLTLWVSEEMGEELGRRGKLMVANKDTV